MVVVDALSSHAESANLKKDADWAFSIHAVITHFYMMHVF